MKIVLFGHERRLGALDGDQVVDLHLACEAMLSAGGDPSPVITARERLGGDLRSFIALGDSALDAAEAAIDFALQAGDDNLLVRLAKTRLHAPWPEGRIACAGGNYADHLAGMQSGPTTIEEIVRTARDAGQWGFWKVPDEVAGPGDEVPYPRRTEYLDYEAEVAIVIGRRGKDISESDIGAYVWGVTLLDDLSIRDGFGRASAMSYNQPKNFDGATAMGPAIVVREGLDPQAIDVELAVNGSLRQHYNSSGMIFSFGEILQYLSRDFTFVPGDVISGGTAAGTAADKTPRPADGELRSKDLFLRPGDSIQLGSPQIGSFLNRVVDADSLAR